MKEEKNKVKLNIYLIRHGEKSGDGSALTVRGLKQIEFLGKRMKKINITKIISSDLPRCKASAEILSKYTKKKAIFTSDLREVEGDVKENPEKHPNEIKIIKNFWTKLTKEKGNILLIGSGNINRILIAIALKINPRNSRFVQIPSGLTHMEYINKDKTRIVYINDTSHLPDKLKQRQAY